MHPELKELSLSVESLRAEVHDVKKQLEENFADFSAKLAVHEAKVESLEHSRRSTELQMAQIQKVVMGMQLDVQRVQRAIETSAAEQNAKLDRILEALKQ